MFIHLFSVWHCLWTIFKMNDSFFLKHKDKKESEGEWMNDKVRKSLCYLLLSRRGLCFCVSFRWTFWIWRCWRVLCLNDKIRSRLKRECLTHLSLDPKSFSSRNNITIQYKSLNNNNNKNNSKENVCIFEKNFDFVFSVTILYVEVFIEIKKSLFSISCKKSDGVSSQPKFC